MNSYPKTIDNGHGEQLSFLGLTEKDGVPCMNVENRVQPNSGPPMHVHFKQDECLTIIKGRMGVELAGEPIYYLEEGASIVFKKGIPHRFFNAGETPLHCVGQIWPVHNIEYFLTEIFRSTKAGGRGRPDPFDAAFLLRRYQSEFHMQAIPPLVKKLVFPIILFVGKLKGKHQKFETAPQAI